ncbi:FAD-binding domain-containing protein [Zopfia rhizophila CBS 207.26]|uniref:FAD-binding domain-containing protein n=1 Tax=Zopfia rhizophila CBS 207.26 TaxID=1314779 RepID=A0A6A6DVQ1_9PEZI|nr:FAD-binding domain-containing protein [Zopfia rhizophila CBS 207.26]
MIISRSTLGFALLATMPEVISTSIPPYSEPTDFDPIAALAVRGISVEELPDTSPHIITASYKNCTAAVSKLASIYSNQVTLLGAPDYDPWRAEFWSKYQESAKPACIFRPKTSGDVAVAVLISRWSSCPFAVKSGGHAAMKGASSSDGGVTIDLVNLNGVDLSEDKKIARLGSGNTWYKVYTTLEKEGLAAVGGRAADIGVGGFTLGGGISFFASIYGWGCDNVANYEVITATGEILQVNYQSFPDLYWALRGGGANFGIVTRFDVETFEQGDIFAGGLAYNYTAHGPAVINAFSKFASNPDPKAATWLVVANRQGTDLLSTLTMYREPNPEAPVFRDYREIPALSNSTKIRTLADMTEQIRSTNPKGLREMYWTHTFKFSKDFITWFAKMFFDELRPVQEKYQGHLPSPVFQIITKDCLARMSRNGGNALPLKEEEAPYMNLIYSCMWQNEADDGAVIGLIAKVMGKAVEEGKGRGIFVDYVYMNYGSEYQDVLGSYGQENFGRLKGIAKKYDPRGLFQLLMPGYFKFSGAPKKEGPGVINV